MTMLAEAVQMQRGGTLQQADRIWPMPVALRRVLLLVPPLLLAGLEILHPQPDENAQALMDVSTWFAGFHAIQLALTGFVALSVLLLADSFGRANAWLTRSVLESLWSSSAPTTLLPGSARGSRCEAHEICRPCNKRVSSR